MEFMKFFPKEHRTPKPHGLLRVPSSLIKIFSVFFLGLRYSLASFPHQMRQLLLSPVNVLSYCDGLPFLYSRSYGQRLRCVTQRKLEWSTSGSTMNSCVEHICEIACVLVPFPRVVGIVMA